MDGPTLIIEKLRFEKDIIKSIIIKIELGSKFTHIYHYTTSNNSVSNGAMATFALGVFLHCVSQTLHILPPEMYNFSKFYQQKIL